MSRAAAAAVLAAALAVLGGCASNAASSVSVGGPPLLPPDTARVVVDGGLVAGATIGISAAAANAIAAVGIITLVAVGNNWTVLPPWRMSEGRTVNVQDCTKPIEKWTANLRCATPEERAQMAREARE